MYYILKSFTLTPNEAMSCFVLSMQPVVFGTSTRKDLSATASENEMMFDELYMQLEIGRMQTEDLLTSTNMRLAWQRIVESG